MSDVNQVVDVSKLYYLVGFVVIANLSTIVAIVWAGLKASWWLSKLDSRVTQNTKDVNAAHKRLREALNA